ncbi:SusC/RagA family TonB-linked outer membrane protein [Flammeovirga aprica]|uniref:TonB-dependent receptor n=1 Tax=Flammeovirga aprica JL-4 TaxID=694437 RepID=A0A7X9XA30_9BACT|nr:TonB-dependent receptor [Flammeovirga aprica]NME69266.1 TonB-dependent receptor [Flammeovirga aprica JL-4]
MFKITFSEILTVCLLSLLSFNVFAQNIIRGVVLDEKKSPIPGANILIKGTTQGTVTNMDGEFSLSTNENDVLLFSYIGYQPQEISVKGKSAIEVQMVLDAKQLEEIVVVGYGVQKKSVVTGAISSIKSEDVESTPIANASQALQGRTSGVIVQSNSGAPGGAVSIKIRGVSSNGNSSPLYIVDGLQVGNINNLSPNDIESIEVLKDAASAAIFGARGANGVVLVTTKQGEKGKYNITYDGYYGIQEAANKVNMLNATEYMRIHNAASEWDNTEPRYSEDRIQQNTIDTDWQDEMYQKAPITNHALSFSGGGKKSNFSSSLSYFSQDGIVGGSKKSNFDRYTFRINSTHEINDVITFGQNLSYSHSKTRGFNEKQQVSTLSSMYLHDPLTPVFTDDPTGYHKNAVTNAEGRYYAISKELDGYAGNPMAILETQNREQLSNTLRGNVYLDFNLGTLVEGLKFKSSLGINNYDNHNRVFTPAFYISAQGPYQNGTSTAQVTTNRNTSIQFENVLSFSRSFGKQNVSAILGQSLISDQYRNTNSTNSDIYPSTWHYGWPSNGGQENMLAEAMLNESRLVSFFGRVSYNYDEKYMLNATIRRDGSTRFGENNKYGIFPSLSAGWTISNEDFFQIDHNKISLIKLRGSWGQVGNDRIGNWGHMSIMERSDHYIVNGSLVQGFAPLRAANPDLKWETSETLNIGIDLGFLNNKLTLTAEYYDKLTKDLLYELPIPAFTGRMGPLANIGTVSNKGVEFDIRYTGEVRNLKIDILGNMSYNHNNMTKLENAEGYFNGRNLGTLDGNMRVQEGYPMPFFFAYKTDGIFQNQEEVNSHKDGEGNLIQPSAKPGDIRFVDINEDGKISDEDRTNIGNAIPKFNYGLTINLGYKNWDFSMFFQAQTHYDIANVAYGPNETYQNLNARHLNYWKGEGTTNEWPAMTHEDANGNFTKINDMIHIEDASYLRLRNLQLGFTLPTKTSKKIGMERFRIYGSVQNLFTITNYSGADPEFSDSDLLRYGLDNGSYPQARTYLMGLNVSF